MREVDGNPAFVTSWNESIKNQRLEKAIDSQSIDLTALASVPMHDRLTFECAQAVEEKMAERLRKGAPGKVYQGWVAEIDRQVAHHEERGEGKSSSSTVPMKRGRSFVAWCVLALWSTPPFEMLVKCQGGDSCRKLAFWWITETADFSRDGQ